MERYVIVKKGRRAKIWNKINYILVSPYKNGTLLKYKKANAMIEEYHNLKTNFSFRILGPDLSRLLYRMRDNRFVYRNNCLINQQSIIPCDVIQNVTPSYLGKRSKDFRKIGQFVFDKNYATYKGFMGDSGKYRYMYLYPGYTILANRGFFYINTRNGLFRRDQTNGRERMRKAQERILLDKDLVNVLFSGIYHVYSNDTKVLLEAYNTSIIMDKLMLNYNIDIKIPQNMIYISYSKEFLLAKKELLKFLFPYTNILMTQKHIVLENNRRKYSCTLFTKGNFGKLKFKILTPIVRMFGPGYYYINTKAKPGILIKRHEENILGTILL